MAIGPFQEVIRQWLQEDQQRPAKQRHTARRIFQRLREEYGFPGSERTVRRAVSALRGTVPESHVPQTYAPAEGGTFDFGEALVKLGGRETRVHLGCLRLDYSSHYFVCALPSERQEALFECHLRGFLHLGGAPGWMRYDNLKPAVHKILRGKNRQEQAAAAGVYRYEAVKSLLSGQGEPSWRQAPLSVWPNRVDHFDRLVHG